MRTTRTVLTTCLLLAGVLASPHADAEEANLPSPPPAGAPTPSGSSASPKGPNDAKPNEAEEKEGADDFRLRIGFNFNGGAIVAPATVGGGGFAFRVGIQPNHLLGVYYQFMPLIFAGASVGTTSASASAIAMAQNSVLVSLTPIDLFEIAAGPSVDYAGLAFAEAGVGGTGTSGGAGTFFGLATRAALHLGGKNEKTGRRTSFTIGLDPHFIFGAGSTVIAITGGLGADWY